MYQHNHKNTLSGRVPTMIGWFDDFQGQHNWTFLSNFYEGHPITIPQIDPRPFATGEHAYAAMKAIGMSQTQYETIREARSPGEAKHLGQVCDLRPDWESVKYDAMMAVLRAKFTLDRYEGTALLRTGDALLIEGTHWQDNVWGVDLRDDQTPATHAPGRNWLGTMLMARRAELKASNQFGQQHPTGIYNSLFASVPQF